MENFTDYIIVPTINLHTHEIQFFKCFNTRLTIFFTGANVNRICNMVSQGSTFNQVYRKINT